MIETRSFVAFASAKEAAVVEHVLGQGIECPEIAFTGIAGLTGNLDEAIVKAEVVSDGILPGREFVFVVGEPGYFKE